MAGKAKQATVLMLSGVAGEAAASAAGFKASEYQGGGGARSSLNRMADALRRAGLPVVSRRGNFAMDADEFQAAKKRGGAAKDLAVLFFMAQVNVARQKRRLMAGVWSYPFEPRFLSPAAGASARVTGLHPLSKAVSGLSAAASASVEWSSLPMLPAQKRRAVAAFNRRKLQGVLRPAPAPAPAPAAGGFSSHVWEWLAWQSERGAAYVAGVAAGVAAAKEVAAAAVARRSGAGLSSSVELRQFKFCPLITSGPLAHGQWFNYRSAWRDSGGVLDCVGFVRV
jgi:hypothetical protein